MADTRTCKTAATLQKFCFGTLNYVRFATLTIYLRVINVIFWYNVQ
jgi:hypothetical protein